MNTYIEEIKSAEPKYVDAIQVLLRQLTSSPVKFSLETLEQIVTSDASRLFVVFCDGEIAGMLTLCSYLTPTGPKSWVEDVVVDQRFRGHHLGRQLVEHAIEKAKLVNENVLMLTSKPARVAANALYRSVGFQGKETNVYKMDFKE